MRDVFQIKDYWESVHEEETKSLLSGCGYAETTIFLQVSNILKPGDRVLEVGVGLGYVTKGLYDNGYKIEALDISEKALKRVSKYCYNNYLVTEIEQLPVDYYDVIICHNGIQHIPTHILRPELKYLIRSLKPSGVFAAEFISSDIAEDTGVDEGLHDEGWDGTIGCYCRTPEYLEKMINEYGGKCKLVYSYYGDLSPHVVSCHIFHITK